MYADLYDEKHRFFGISNIPTKPNKLFQKGLRERLLCASCEQQFSRYESYANRVFYGNEAQHVTRVPKGLLIQNLRYTELKLFFLSLLWRFSVTKIDQYRGADLGPYTEPLRQLLVSEDPGDYLEFPCLVVAMMLDGKHIADMIVRPAYTRLEKQRVWSCVVGGFLFSFFVGKSAPLSGLHGGFLQRNGTLFLQVEDIRQIDFLYKFACEMGAAQRRRPAQGSEAT